MLRAILLLIVYSSFTAGAAFAGHICQESCSGSMANHTGFTDSGNTPAECAEKEALNNNTVEQRAGTSIRILYNTPLNKEISYENHSNTIVAVTFVETGTSNAISKVPFYIWHCVYRL